MTTSELLALAKRCGASVYTHRTMPDNPSVAFGNMAQLSTFAAALMEASPYVDMYMRLCDAAGYDSGKDGLEVSPEEFMAKLKAALAGSVPDGWKLAPIEPVAWIEHHKGGDNLNWERVDHPYAKATPLYGNLSAQVERPDMGYATCMRCDNPDKCSGVKRCDYEPVALPVVVAWQVRWTASRHEPQDANPWQALTHDEYTPNPSRDEHALVRLSDAMAVLAAKGQL